MSQQVTHIKQDAVVSIQLGTQIINQLQATLGYLIEGKSEQDILAIKEHAEAGVPLTSWELSTVTITNLLQAIYASAVEHDQTITKSLDDSIAAITG